MRKRSTKRSSGTYSASKKSIEIIADTLRHEVQPLGVNVKIIVTGVVVSKGQTYFYYFALPENSLYKRIEPTIAARARGEDGMTRMLTVDYATAVVDDITKQTSGRFWFGEYADGVKYAWTPQVPQEMLVSPPQLMLHTIKPSLTHIGCWCSSRDRSGPFEVSCQERLQGPDLDGKS